MAIYDLDDESGQNPLATIDQELRQNHLRDSSELIYESVMRGGGEPFMAPFDVGTATLTDGIVKRFKLKGFFGFETVERTKVNRRRNKFTRYGATNRRNQRRKDRSGLPARRGLWGLLFGRRDSDTESPPK